MLLASLFPRIHMIELLPIAQPEIDFKTFLTATKRALVRNIDDKLNESLMMNNDAKSFLCLLGEMIDPEKTSIQHIINPSIMADHLYFTFLLIAPQNIFPALSDWTKLNTLTVRTVQELFILSVVSGTLSIWREAIINCSKISSVFELRQFGNKAMLLFEQAGFSQMFSDLTKMQLPDRTFYLGK